MAYLKLSKSACTFVAALSMLLAGTANAEFQVRLGGQAVYDTDRKITWLADTNLAKTNTFGVSGIETSEGFYTGNSSNVGNMTFATAVNWLGALNAADYLGFSDWRLPTTAPINGSALNNGSSTDGTTDIGYNIGAPGTTFAGNGSEMAHLFYGELGNKAYYDFDGNSP